MSSPETPKSHILISPRELHSIFDGLISVSPKKKTKVMVWKSIRTTSHLLSRQRGGVGGGKEGGQQLTTMNDTMDVV